MTDVAVNPQEEEDQAAANACPNGSIVMESTPLGVMFRPSPKRVTHMVRLLFLFAFVFPLLLAALVILFEGRMMDSMGAVVSLVSFVLIVTGSAFGAAWWYRNSPTIPLIVEPTGRVSYGTQVLLEVGANPRFHIESRDVGSEGVVMSYSVVATNRWGPLVVFPSPWFDEFDDLGVARWFARELEAAVRPRPEAPAPVPGEPSHPASPDVGFVRRSDTTGSPGELR